MGAEQRIFEHNGMLWKFAPDGTSTFDDFLQARDRWLEIFQEIRWNPWRTDELEHEQERAYRVMGNGRAPKPTVSPNRAALPDALATCA